MFIYKVTLEATNRGKGTGRIVNLGLYDSIEKAHIAVKESLDEEGFDSSRFSWDKAWKITALRKTDSKNVSYVWSVKKFLVK